MKIPVENCFHLNVGHNCKYRDSIVLPFHQALEQNIQRLM